jgi:tRNA(Ile)-lysidine synthase
MLAALAPLAGERGFVLRCFHVEHGIRPAAESRGDADAVKELALRFGIPWKICHIPPGTIARAARRWGSGIEAAARRFRHRAFNRERRRIGAVRILVAHTRDDLLETVLMGVLRGSGPAGLAAMPPARGRLLRPLLTAGRAEILDWLARQNIPYRTDSTNLDTNLFRNRVRLRVLPLLDAEFPGWRGALLRLAETQRLTADFLSAEAARRIPWRGGGGGGCAFDRGFSLAVDRDRFFAAPPLIREEAVFRGADLLAQANGRAGKREDQGAAGSDGAASARRGAGADAGQSAGQRRPRRDAVRRFAAGDRAALDLGPLRGEIRGDTVTLGAPVRGGDGGGGERGFSRLITAPGRYALFGLTITVGAEASIGAESAGALERAAPGKAKNSVICAGLPLALRSRLPADARAFPALAKRRFLEYTGFITVCDRRGAAAVVGIGADTADVVARRDEPGKNTGGIFVMVCLGAY